MNIVLLMVFQGPDSRGEVAVFKRKISGSRIFYDPEYRIQGEDIGAFTEQTLPIGRKRISGLFRGFFSCKL